MRIFVALDLDKNFKKEIERIQKELPEFIGKKTEFENLHLTLKFLGEVSEEHIGKIIEGLKSVKLKKFKAKLGKLGVFFEKFVRIVWIEILNCQELQEQIDDNLKDLFEPERRFMGHVTIARVKKVEDRVKFINELKKIKVADLSFEVKEFKLKKSILTEKGPVYEEIEKFDFE